MSFDVVILFLKVYETQTGYQPYLLGTKGSGHMGQLTNPNPTLPNLRALAGH